MRLVLENPASGKEIALDEVDFIEVEGFGSLSAYIKDPNDGEPEQRYYIDSYTGEIVTAKVRVWDLRVHNDVTDDNWAFEAHRLSILDSSL